MPPANLTFTSKPFFMKICQLSNFFYFQYGQRFLFTVCSIIKIRTGNFQSITAKAYTFSVSMGKSTMHWKQRMHCCVFTNPSWTNIHECVNEAKILNQWRTNYDSISKW